MRRSERPRDIFLGDEFQLLTGPCGVSDRTMPSFQEVSDIQKLFFVVGISSIAILFLLLVLNTNLKRSSKIRGRHARLKRATLQSAATDACAQHTELRKRWKDLFVKIDGNKDGNITKAELIRALKKDGKLCADLGLAAVTNEGSSGGALARDKFMLFFGEIDDDNNKVLSEKEFFKALEKKGYGVDSKKNN